MTVSADKLPCMGPGRVPFQRLARLADAGKPPLRIFLGDGLLAIVTSDCQCRLDAWREWEPVSIAAHGAKD